MKLFTNYMFYIQLNIRLFFFNHIGNNLKKIKLKKIKLLHIINLKIYFNYHIFFNLFSLKNI